MKTRRMITIDKFLGPVVCAALRVWDIGRRVVQFFINKGKKQAPSEVKKILIIKCFGMGSIVLSTPMLRALKRKFPEAKITYFTFRSNKEICRMIPQIDRVITVRTGNIISFIFSFLATLPKLWKARFDVAVDLEFFARFSTVVSYLSGAPRRMGFYMPTIWRGGILTDPIALNHTKNVREVFCHLIRPLGIEAEDFSLELLTVPAKAHAEVKRVLQEDGAHSDKLNILININSSDLAYERRWPREYFADIVERLKLTFPATIYLIGGKGDKSYVDEFVSTLPKDAAVVNLAGKLSVSNLVALSQSMDLVLVSDDKIIS